MSAEKPDAPRIIVDDDWKERVQAEKAALERQRGGAAAADNDSPPGAAGEAAAAAADNRQEQQDQPPLMPPPPPASFEGLIVSLATQASYALANAGGSREQGERQLAWARYFVDTLQVLETKTQGHLEAEESQLLAQVLHELRMACVETQTRLSSVQTTPRP